MGLILHCGGEQVTRADIESVPVPTPTRSWKPVSYGDALAFIENEANDRGMTVVRENYGLNKKGNQMFGVLTLDTGRADQGMALGYRASYNKSLAPTLVGGASVFVCDNLCISGSSFKVVRRNTVNVWRDLTEKIVAHLDEVTEHYEQVTKETDAMREVGVETDLGYAALGTMFGHGILTPNQASVAFQDWREPRHEEFEDRNLWSLYNCVTEGLKKGPAGGIFSRHAKAHGFFVENLVPVLMADGELEYMSAPEASSHGIDDGQIGRAILRDMLN